MISELWAQIQHEFNKFLINLVNFQIQNRKKVQYVADVADRVLLILQFS